MSSDNGLSAEDAVNASDAELAETIFRQLGLASNSDNPTVRNAAGKFSNLIDNAGDTPTEPEPGPESTEPAPIDLSGSEEPDPPATSRPSRGDIFGPDADKEPVDPTTVADPGVSESVTDRSSGIDFDALGKTSDDEDMDDPTLGGYENDLNSSIERFAPSRPTVPKAAVTDESLGETGPAESTPTPPSHTEPDDDPFANVPDLDDDDEDYAVAERTDETEDNPGVLGSLKNKWSGLPTWGKAVGIALPVVLILGGFLLSPGDDGTRGGAPANQGGGGVVAENPAPQPAAPSGKDKGNKQSGEPELLTEHIKTVSAKCAEGGTSPKEAFTSNEESAWVCPRSLGIDGSVLNIVFDKPVQITEIRFTPGYNYVRQPGGDDEWTRHRVVGQVVWRAGGQNFVQTIEPARSEAIYEMEKPVSTDAMSMTIQKSVGPDKTKGDSLPGSPAGGSGDGKNKPQDATAVQNIQIIGKVL